MRPKIVAGNWKMNGDSAFLDAYAEAFRAEMTRISDSVKVMLSLPHTLLSDGATLFKGSGINLGAQNVAAWEVGAYTGEVSAAMLADAGCSWCIVGHSERRALLHETDADVVAKVLQLQQQGLQPVVCVGETLSEREAGNAEAVVESQIQALLNALSGGQFETVVMAYEPVWAIGTGKTATPEQAQQMHAFIRSKIAGVFPDVAENMAIIYGGSVNSGNAETLFNQQDIDGALVGGASLKTQEFAAICNQIG